MLRRVPQPVSPPDTDVLIVPTRSISPASKRLLGLCMGLVGLFMLLLAGGFLAFIERVSRFDTEFGRKVDGVVALTGGPERITEALSVLAEQRAKRLLITGVGERTHIHDLVKQSGHANLFACCVDIDKAALNTVGNAVETAQWVKQNGYQSLLVVTSNYHMPRAMVELRRHLKRVELVPHPVIGESVKTDEWWSDLSLARLLFSEYLKYLVSEARSRLVPDNPERR